jgi:hypothetical protein
MSSSSGDKPFHVYLIETGLIVGSALAVSLLKYFDDDDRDQINLNWKNFMVYVITSLFILGTLMVCDKHMPSMSNQVRSASGWLLGAALISILNITTSVPVPAVMALSKADRAAARAAARAAREGTGQQGQVKQQVVKK